jgi:hypothetical protein
MAPSKIPFKDLHLLWPRGDGAVLFLSYLITASQNGNIPRFTDKWFARKRRKHTATIARWRARWESMGILKTQRRGQATHYVIDWVALDLAIREARRLDDLAQTEARGQAIAARVARDAQIAEELRQQCLTADPVTQHLADSNSDNCQLLQETKKKRSSVLTDEESRFHENQGSHISESEELEPEPEPKTNLETKKQSHPEAESDETFKNASENNHQENAISAAARAWFFEAAKRLIANSGKRWNKTLQLALNALDTDRLINLISAFWEQTLKGNVQDGPKWLCKAAQKVANGNSYRPTRKFRVPGHLPEPPAIAPAPGPSSTLPSWLPAWAVRPAEILLKAIGSFDRIETVDGGVQVFWDGGKQFIADPQGGFSSRLSHLA